MKCSRTLAAMNVTAVTALCLCLLSITSCNSSDAPNAQENAKNKGRAVMSGKKPADETQVAADLGDGSSENANEQTDEVKVAMGSQPQKAGNKGKNEPEGSIVLHITSKLGVKTKVKVKTTTTNPWDGSAEKILSLNRGDGLDVFISLRHVNNITTKEEGSLVTLTDGSKHGGRIQTIISVDPSIDDSNQFDLSRAADVVNETTTRMKKPDPNRPLFRLKVAETEKKKIIYPDSRTFDVYAPRISYTSTSARFFIILGTERLRVNPVDFERIAVSKVEKDWQMTVKAPDAPEKAGKFFVPRGSVPPLVFETTSGIYVVFTPGVGSPPGFTLEKKPRAEAQKE